MSKIRDDELAVKITAEDGITGGLGAHPKGAVLRDLSRENFNLLTQTGAAEAVPAGTEVRNAEPAEPVAVVGQDDKKAK